MLTLSVQEHGNESGYFEDQDFAQLLDVLAYGGQREKFASKREGNEPAQDIHNIMLQSINEVHQN
jgi:hypothetical protein